MKLDILLESGAILRLEELAAKREVLEKYEFEIIDIEYRS